MLFQSEWNEPRWILYSHPWSSVSSGEKVLHMVPPTQMMLLCNLHPILMPLLRVSWERRLLGRGGGLGFFTEWVSIGGSSLFDSGDFRSIPSNEK